MTIVHEVLNTPQLISLIKVEVLIDVVRHFTLLLLLVALVITAGIRLLCPGTLLLKLVVSTTASFCGPRLYLARLSLLLALLGGGHPKAGHGLRWPLIRQADLGLLRLRTILLRLRLWRVAAAGKLGLLLPPLVLLAEEGHARALVVGAGSVAGTVLRESLAAVDHQVGASIGLV